MSNPLNHIAIIDYGMGNLHSVSKALEHVGENVKISVTADPTVINSADRVVFPGVGAIGDCMSEILRLDIGNILKNCIHQKPVLAICVGMQALLEHSEESGGVDCLKIVQVKFGNLTTIILAPLEIKLKYLIWVGMQSSNVLIIRCGRELSNIAVSILFIVIMLKQLLKLIYFQILITR